MLDNMHSSSFFLNIFLLEIVEQGPTHFHEVCPKRCYIHTYIAALNDGPIKLHFIFYIISSPTMLSNLTLYFLLSFVIINNNIYVKQVIS